MTETPTSKEERLSSFNPNEYLMKIKRTGKPDQDYLEVKWRLVWFRSVFPHGTIDTQEIVVDLDREIEAEVYVWNSEKRRSEKVLKRAKGYARYKAIVTDGLGGRGTGTKTETAIDFPDFVEKSETGAIGRALASLGYGTQFTGEEFNENHRIVDSPINSSTTTDSAVTPSPLSPLPITTPQATPTPIIAPVAKEEALVSNEQRTSIRKLCTQIGKDEPPSLATMKYQEAKALIGQLNAEFKAHQQEVKRPVAPTPAPVVPEPAPRPVIQRTPDSTTVQENQKPVVMSLPQQQVMQCWTLLTSEEQRSFLEMTGLEDTLPQQMSKEAWSNLLSNLSTKPISGPISKAVTNYAKLFAKSSVLNLKDRMGIISKSAEELTYSEASLFILICNQASIFQELGNVLDPNFTYLRQNISVDAPLFLFKNTDHKQDEKRRADYLLFLKKVYLSNNELRQALGEKLTNKYSTLLQEWKEASKASA